jgi:class 3 adenylate cyclase
MEARGIIWLADISGYTEFLTRTEIDHANMVMMNLFSAMLDEAPLRLKVVEVEGDALFCWIPFQETPPSMEELFGLVNHQFQRFVGVQRWFVEAFGCPKRCDCQVCQSLVKLRLKFVLHKGQVGVYRIRDFEKIAGVDVVVAHRLLKNRVAEPEYVLVTEELLAELGGGVQPAHWREGEDLYPVLGRIPYRYHPLVRPESPPLVEPSLIRGAGQSGGA